MKEILLHSLTLTNWRGEKQRTTRFNTGAPTYICGDNGLGKSRHFDAFCWLLFGKDSHDRKDFELRTYDERHEPLHHCECSVSAELTVDGEPVTLKREYREDWVKPRGQAEEVLKGNVTECTWNGVPVKVSDYQRRIRESIIDETVFKMITNPRYFTEKMKWQLQREQLLQMAGTKPDAEIAAGNKDFETLLDKLNGKSLSDFRKEIAAQKKRLNAEKDGIGPRIDQVRKMTPQAVDWEALEAERKSLKERIDDTDARLLSADKRDEATQSRIASLRKDITDLAERKAELVRQYQKRADDEADARNRERDGLQASRRRLFGKRHEINDDIIHTNERMTYLKGRMDYIDTQLAALREEWFEISKAEYAGSDICPTCGQRLPQSMTDKAREAFGADKRRRLEENSGRGKSLASQKKSYSDELQGCQGRLEQLEADLKDNEKRTTDVLMDIGRHPAAQRQAVDPSEIKEWVEADDRQKELLQEISDLTCGLANSAGKAERDRQAAELRRQRDGLQERLDEVKASLADRKRIEDDNAEIGRLEARGKELAQQIAALERREFVASEFSMKRIKDCEARVNSLFSLVRFQLFDTTQDGNEFECCTPLLDGTPYGVVNTAGKLNMGLDIINTLCRFNNVSAPIFIDSAESVNHPIGTRSQLIFLRVTTDKELIIK